MTDEALLANRSYMELLQGIEANEFTRSTGQINGPYLWRGEVVSPVTMRLLAEYELVRTALAGPPRLEPRGVTLLRRARNRELLAQLKLDPAYFRVDPTGRIVELTPATCPAGHPLRPDTVALDTDACSQHQVHRAWLCRQCGQVWHRPACSMRPDWHVWAGRPISESPGQA